MRQRLQSPEYLPTTDGATTQLVSCLATHQRPRVLSWGDAAAAVDQGSVGERAERKLELLVRAQI